MENQKRNNMLYSWALYVGQNNTTNKVNVSYIYIC